MEAEGATEMTCTSYSGPGDKDEEEKLHNRLELNESRNQNSENREGSLDLEEDMDLTEDDIQNFSGNHAANSEQVEEANFASTETSGGVVETLRVINEKVDGFISDFPENGYIDARSGGFNSTSSSGHTSSKSGVKRARTTTSHLQQPAVHVSYSSLTRDSRRKLEQLLRQWSEWHAENGSSAQSSHDEILESGEETYFPALRIGLKNTSSVAYWIDQQTGDSYYKGNTPIDSSSAPLYDRSYALGLTTVSGLNNLESGLEIMGDPSRCFNCGSYGHSLKECPKPRDNTAVNTAREQYRTKRNQNPVSRLPARYYQTSSGGKYDGLKPGSLIAETRELLGLKEFDPPPWLNRMRELGYPPGYLDNEEDSSRIMIYGDEDNEEEEREDGEIDERTELPEPQKKMTVEFPGVNGPIPENADRSLWSPMPSSSDQSLGQWPSKSSLHCSRSSRENYYEQRSVHELREGLLDDELILISSNYSPRSRRREYDYDSCILKGFPRGHRSPSIERSYSARGRRSFRAYDDYPSPDAYNISRYTPLREQDYDDWDRRPPLREHEFDDWDRDDHDRYHFNCRRY